MSRRILIVDDSLTVRMDLDRIFKDAGYETVLSASAREARAEILRQPPALLILDVLLPDADGVSFLGELRGSPVTADLPVMLLSSETEVKDRVRGLTKGANEYIGKPYSAQHVLARARACLGEDPAGDRGAPTVLIIDDSLTFRSEVSEALRQAGYRTALAASGEEGLLRAAEVRPDAVIVDGVMPGIDGTAVVRRIRLDPALSATPCLLLTASEGVTGEIEALDAGVDAWLRKTEDFGVLLARLGAMLRTADGDSSGRFRAVSLLAPKKILAVDDSTTYLECLAEQLLADGYEVLKAGSGEDALELLAVEKVDCVLLDLMMPGLSGTETCRRIRLAPATSHLPILILTAVEDQESMIHGINAGADDYIAKSSDLNVLTARIRAHLRRKQLEEENRRVREKLLRKEAEARSAHDVAEARQALLDQISKKNTDLSFHAAELERLNNELKTFAYSVSHDLRQPLRSLDGYSHILLEKYSGVLDEEGRRCLERLRAGTRRMGELIEGLLSLSRVNSKPLETGRVDLEGLARRILARHAEADGGRHVETQVQPGLEAVADPQLMESLMENLLGNAWKFTSKSAEARIEVGSTKEGHRTVFHVRDNGAGFDMSHSESLFTPFQRLHSRRDFEGSGIGLATVQRIILRHGGRIWAESTPGRGASFFFTLRSEEERQELPEEPRSSGEGAMSVQGELVRG